MILAFERPTVSDISLSLLIHSVDLPLWLPRTKDVRSILALHVFTMIKFDLKSKTVSEKHIASKCFDYHQKGFIRLTVSPAETGYQLLINEVPSIC